MIKIGSGFVVGQFEDVPIRQRLAPQYLMVFFQRWAGAVGVSAVCIRVEIKRGIDDGRLCPLSVCDNATGSCSHNGGGVTVPRERVAPVGRVIRAPPMNCIR